MGNQHSKEAQTGHDEPSQPPSTKAPEAPRVVEEVTSPIVLNLSAEGIDSLPPNEKNLVTLFLTHNPCEGFSLKQVKALTSCRNLQVLDLSNNAIKTELTFLNELKNLKVLSLFNNRLTNIDLSNELLESVDLGFNDLSQFPNLPRTISNVNLDHNFISVVDYQNSDNLEFKNLQKLSLAHNKIGVINQNFRFNSLSVLNLAYNNLAGLPDLTVFAPRIRQLDISFNRIPVLPNLPRTLVYLNAKNNKIRTLPKNLVQLSYLLYLDLSNNFIKQVPQLPTSLQTLFLNDNIIESIAPSTLPDIVRLFVFNNRLTEFPQIVGSSIVEYYLAGNLISTMSNITFGKSTTKIDLSRNNIQSFPEEFFQLPQLAILLLSHNQIEDFPQVTGSLNVLDLSYNPLSKVPELPPTIERLHLTGCGLKELPSELSELPDLLTLELSENHLTDIPELPVLRHLNISSNAFSTLPKLPESLQYLDISFNQIAALPKNFSQPKLRVLDASWADLRVFPREANLPELEYLKIQGNPIISQIPINKMPKLMHMDISTTQAHFDVNSVPDNLTIVCSEPTLFRSQNFRLIPELTPRYGYATALGKLQYEEDAILMRPDFYRGIDVMATVDGRSKATSSTVFKFATGLQHFDDVFNTENVTFMIERIEEHLHKERTSMPQFSLLLRYGDAIIAAGSGGFGAVVAGRTGGARELINSPKLNEQRPNAANAKHGILGDDGVLGANNIMKKPFLPPKRLDGISIVRAEIGKGDRFLIGCSSSVLTTIGLEGINTAATAAGSARELAMALVRAVQTELCTDNVSVVVCQL